MKAKRVVKGVLVSLAVVGFCLPQTALAAGASVGRAPIVVDVALTDGGVLYGQVVDPQGSALVKVPVLLRDRDRELARAVTDKNGYFAVRGLRGGVYQLATVGGQGMFRLWKPGSAPPASEQGALLIVQGDTVRGQCESCGEPTCGAGCDSCGGARGEPACGSRLAVWLANPWVVAGIVATAVAVPVAIHNSGRPASP